MNIKFSLSIFIRYVRDLKIFKAFSYAINVFDFFITIKILKRKEVIRKVNKYPMLLTFDEEGISKNLFIYRIREIGETDTIKDIVRTGMKILEIGANIGYYTILLGKLVGKTGKLYSYEPYTPSFKVLLKNIKINNLSNIVKAHNLAISNRSIIQKFYIGQATNVHTLMDLHQEKTNKNFMMIKTTDINHILEKIKKKIDLVRMDIEGYEREIFNRLSELKKDLLPDRIFFEIHPLGNIDPDPSFNEPIQNILNLGYYPELVISSSNLTAFKRFKELNYFPYKTYNLYSKKIHFYNNIKVNDLLKVAARRPKMTRAILLKKLK